MPIFNNQVMLTSSPTITAGAYSANDVIGGLITLDVASAGGGGTLKRIIIADADNEKAAIDFYFFNGTAPTTIADNAAFAPVITDLKKLVGKVSVAAGDYTTVNTTLAYAFNTSANMDYSASTLYCYAVVTGTPTYTATTDLTFRFGFWKD